MDNTRFVCFVAYLLEILERLVARQTLLLAHAPVNGDRGEVLLDQELRQGHAPLDRLDEDDHLVELQDVEQVEQLPVLLRILELDVVLPQSVKGQLGLVVDVDFHGLQRKEVCYYLHPGHCQLTVFIGRKGNCELVLTCPPLSSDLELPVYTNLGSHRFFVLRLILILEERTASLDFHRPQAQILTILPA